MAKIVFEQKVSVVLVEDAECARIVEFDDDDSHLSVRLHSWDEECVHGEFNKFYGKKVRITVETIDE